MKAYLVDNDKYSVKCFRTNHRIECYGFVFSEKKKPRRLILEAEEKTISRFIFMKDSKMGKILFPAIGEVIKNEWVTETAPKGKILCFLRRY